MCSTCTNTALSIAFETGVITWHKYALFVGTVKTEKGQKTRIV